jgi:ATP-dependent exoDNAse (exonuclease V) beta subunit
MSGARHVMILASAGSGKTYALTSRFVRLLAEGARPERIVALTFTRKAAGEFFDEILKKLAAAAADAAEARRLAREIGRPSLGRAEFLGMLRSVTEAMPRLRLGTLDSFFARIARAFPLELGLAGEFEILQEHAARLERRRVLRRMFARAGALGDAQKEFIEAFKRATFGREEKRLGAQLDAFLDDHQEIYLAAPVASRWGDPARIWPDGNPWLAAKVGREGALRDLRAAWPWSGLNEKQRVRLENFFRELPEWQPGAPLPAAVEYLLKNALAVLADLRAGRAELMLERKKVSLDAGACAALLAVVAVILGGELTRRLEATRGIFAVLQGYERTYHDAVRRAGKLTFADVQRLLAPGAGAPALTRDAAAAEGRLFIDYRLDAEIDHWLLDEFQDTSFGQWSVLKNLIDEAVQDSAGGRSFFCVGDVKQAIFTWREGDPRLFREIFNHYNAAAPGAIAAEHLDKSQRSGPALIEMVNTVFGNAPALAKLFPGPMSAVWNAEWRPHVSVRPGHTGQAAWLLADDRPARWARTLELLRELRPVERGLSCAVLAQTNDATVELADFLRRAGGLPAVAESDLPVCTDNPLGAALLALIQAAAHPGDTLAQEHVRMTPLGAVLAEAGLTTPERLTERVLGQFHEEGFERTLEFWVRAVEPRLAADDAFSRERARQLVDAARLYDATGGRDAAEFRAFAERHTVREPEGAAVVRVMTIHKSKGLGFDVVLVPDLEGTRLDQARRGLAAHKAADRSVEWVLEAPAKLIAQSDAVLAAHFRQAEAEAGYEALSLLYVALTRAKRALYVITEPMGDSQSLNYPRVLAETLGGDAEKAGGVRVGALRLPGRWSAGEPDWAEKLAPPAAAGETASSVAVLAPVVSGSRRWAAVRPSARPAGLLTAESLFTLQRMAGADFGTAVHRLLAEIEWGAAREMEAAWAARGEPEMARAEALAVLRAPELAGVWSRPAGAQAEVWRERAFELVIEGAWVSGVFDRVVVERDATGRTGRATVFDFKTDRADEGELAAAARRHDGQMRLYRQAAARLAGLPLGAVRAEVVFTRARRSVAAGMDG